MEEGSIFDAIVSFPFFDSGCFHDFEAARYLLGPVGTLNERIETPLGFPDYEFST
jgi:hypothetical protein